MEICERSAGSTTILELRGALLGPSCQALRKSVQRVLAAGVRGLALDVQNVPAIDAEGVGALVELHRETLGRGTSLRLVNAKRRVLLPLRLAHVDRVIETAAFSVIDCGFASRVRRPA
jgi:anti-anti-sigma factor